jgi:hypothetical protein
MSQQAADDKNIRNEAIVSRAQQMEPGGPERSFTGR